jgi:tetratricopeptide (TPR) repeat protein
MSDRLPSRPFSALTGLFLAGALVSILAVPGALHAQDHHHHPAGGELVGSVSFPVSCAPEVQERFDRAVAMLHSFWFEESARAFAEIVEADPGCAMAHWGRAMNLWGNPMTRAAPPPDRAQEAARVVARARELASSATHREQMYIEAVAALFDDQDRTGHLERMQAHEDAMRLLVEMHPEDPEAAIFLGRIMVGNAPPDDLSFSRQLAAAEIMEPLFEEHPDHPGLAHYIIHAFDFPAMAEHGLDAAFRYADIAPDAPHALHMPSHIFTRVGYWEESIEMNARSAAAEPVPDAAVHPMDYMVYAYLQLGRDRDAGEVVATAREIPDRYYGGLLGYNFAAMHARYALERERWDEAARVEVPGEALPYVQAVSRFARAVGMARSDRGAEAEHEVAALAELADQLRAQGDAEWATRVSAQHLAASAWAARAQGRDEDALRLAREAADLEDTVEKHPVTPGPLLPARELLGDLLMELGRTGEALAEYEATLEKEPRRARALFGAARAAEAAGDHDRARAHYEELVDLLADADPERPEPRAARRFLEGQGRGAAR